MACTPAYYAFYYAGILIAYTWQTVTLLVNVVIGPCMHVSGQFGTCPQHVYCIHHAYIVQLYHHHYN